ncbi:alpha/beta hydrolase [Rhodococcus tukisamuensis]|uniref:Alpha/beta hydrolase fold n=1 Tax=Rhodococcus tukisamuensis TaxID=168276 RepID=A0A1G7BPB7_9NOCA|nr:alpha/beta hydrolase [Rhodococcus tukisamuensis]SDE28899.1 alpha/beta hydrolase fold [Rhodococcus tukisamuensis]
MPLRRTTPVLLAAAAVVTTLVAGCGTPVDGEATAASGDSAASEGGSFRPGAGVVPAGLEKFYTQDPQWGSCDDFVTDGAPLASRVECTRITVPVNYDDPAGETAQLAVSRSRATGDKIGSLLVNPGGPGASGLGQASVGLDTALETGFDVVGFDPRGIGASTPQVQCLTPAEADAERTEPQVDMSPAGIAAIEHTNRDYADKCAQRSGTNLLAHVGTREVVRDMDVIRSVLGDEKLSYLGFSYGTRIGTTYAETFPGNVRAMVLDGAIDPAQDPVESTVLQAAGFQQAFDAFAADCVATSPDCPLGADPAQAVARFRALVDPLVDRPAQTTDPRGLSYPDAITGVQQALYSPNLWGSLRSGLSALGEGRGDTLLLLADLYEGRQDDGSYSNINDAFNAVRCVDDPPVTDRAQNGAADTAFRRAAPFLDDGRGTGSAPLDICAFWPVPHTGTPHPVDAKDLPLVVVVSTTEDPATPYQAGVDLAKQVGGALITFRGTQHTVAMSGVSCVDDAVVAYLTGLDAPASDLTCS